MLSLLALRRSSKKNSSPSKPSRGITAISIQTEQNIKKIQNLYQGENRSLHLPTHVQEPFKENLTLHLLIPQHYHSVKVESKRPSSLMPKIISVQQQITKIKQTVLLLVPLGKASSVSQSKTFFIQTN